MNNYIFPIKIALITFPFIAFLITIPFMLVQYRVHGYVNKLRTLILYSFLLYIIVAYYLVILPLPEQRDILSIQSENTIHYNLKPFSFIENIIKETKVNIKSVTTYKNILTERAFLQVIFNMILLVPLGIYLRYYFRCTLKKTLIISFGVSLFFELTQLSGLYGYYNAPYRLFDVDDLMLNTLGGFIGYKITPIFSWFLPKSDQLDDKINLDEVDVGYIRRAIAMIIDLWLLGIIPHYRDDFVTMALINFMYFVVLIYIFNGVSIGLWLTGLKIVGKDDDRLSFEEILLRNGVFYVLIKGINQMFSDFIRLNESTEFTMYLVIPIILQLIFNIAIYLNLIVSIINKKRLFFEESSNTRVELNK